MTTRLHSNKDVIGRVNWLEQYIATSVNIKSHKFNIVTLGKLFGQVRSVMQA